MKLEIKIFPKYENGDRTTLNYHILNALKQFGSIDCDFDGSNGPEYLWDEAKDQGYSSNLEYILERIKLQFNYIPENINETDLISEYEQIVRGFFKSWLSYNPTIVDYSWSFIYSQDNPNQVIGIAFSYYWNSSIL